MVDSYVQLSNAGRSAAQAGGVDVVGPDGRHSLALSEAARAQSFQVKRAGFYQVHFVNGRDALIAVNPDRRESDLQAIPDDVLKMWSGSGGDPQAVSQAPYSAQPVGHIASMWWWIMLCVLVVAISESIVSSRYLGTLREEA